MAPRGKKKETDETPPDSPGATYDTLVYICLKDPQPAMWLPADHVFADEQTVDEVVGHQPTKKLSLQQRAKIHNFLMDETEPTKAMSIFCRVEKGVDESRLQTLLKDLNARFKSLPYPQKCAVKASLIKNWGEKFMKNWTYNERDPITGKITYQRWGKVSLRSGVVEKLPSTAEEGDDSDEDFKPRSEKRGAKKVISSSSEGQGSSPLSSQSTATGGSFIGNPFFTPSRTSGMSSKELKERKGSSKKSVAPVIFDPQPGTSKDAAASSKEPPASEKKSAKKDSGEKKRKRIVEETSESDTETLKSVSPTKKPTLEKRVSNAQQMLVPVVQLGPKVVAEAPHQEQAAAGAENILYDITVPRVDLGATYTEAVVISEQQLDDKLRSFLNDLERTRATSEPFKAVIKAAVDEALAQRLDEVCDALQDMIITEVKKVLEALTSKATKSSTTRILEAINGVKTVIEDFSIEQARIRCEIGNITENAAEKQSRSCGILGRFLPFDFMGVAFDLFMSSHYVQSKVVALIKDEFDARQGKINVRIGFAFTNVFLTRVAMAHLIWRHPKNRKKMLYYKRQVPESFEKIIKTDIIPFIRSQLQLGGETFVGSFEGVRKVIATRFSNARTKLLEVAFAEAANPEAAMEALHNMDNEFYVQNVHAIPPGSAMEDLRQYKEKLQAARAECSLGEDREQAGKAFRTQETLFDSLRQGGTSKKVFTMYEVMQGIIAAAKADGQDVTKLTFDQPKNCPDFNSVYKKCLDDHVADLDALLSKFPVDTKLPRRARSDSENEEEEQLKDVTLGSGEEESDEVDEESTDAGSKEEFESPSELEKNVATITLSSSDEESIGRCHSQQQQAQEQPAQMDVGFTVQSRFTNPISVSLRQERSGADTSSKPVATRFDDQGRPIKPALPPLPDNPYAVPDPFANLTSEELEARILAAQKRLQERNKDKKPYMK